MRLPKVGISVFGKSGASLPNGNPSACALTVVDDTTLQVDWTNGATNQDGTYAYYSTSELGTYTLGATIVGSGTSGTIPGLTAGTLYYVKLAHYKGTKLSEYSNIDSAFTLPDLAKFIYLGYYENISSGQMPNELSEEYITVDGSAGSETYQVPNAASYIAADTDYIWFKTDETQRTTTTAELIGYDLPRTLVKYDSSSPYQIRAIAILKSGETLTESESNSVREYFELSVWWSNVLSGYGVVKDNRGIGQSVWTPEAVYEPELVTYKAGLSTPLSAGELTLLNDLIVGLKADLEIETLDEDFDVIRIMAGETSEVSLKNLVKNSHHATLQGTSVPTFTQYEGFTGTGSGYIDTNYSPNNEGIRYTSNNCSYGLYFRSGDSAGSTVSAAGINDTTAGKLLVYLNNNSQFDRAWINSAEAEVIDITFAAGFLIKTRTNTTVAHYINGVGGTGTETMSMFGNGNLYILSRNIIGTGAGSNFSLAQVSIEMAGRYFTLTEHEKIRARFETFMDAHGKGVVA